MKPIKPFYVLVLIIIVAAGGFYGGMMYQKSKSPSPMMGGDFGRGAGVGAGGFQVRQGNGPGMRPISGDIVSQDTKSITVKLPDGSSKIVNFTDQTKINKATEGSVADLKSGERVTVFGATSADGSITAQNISIGNGMFRVKQQQQ